MLKIILVEVFIIQITCEQQLIVKTTSGYIRGKNIDFNDDCVQQYLNIPYAEPPVGKLRFARPSALDQPLKVIIQAK